MLSGIHKPILININNIYYYEMENAQRLLKSEAVINNS